MGGWGAKFPPRPPSITKQRPGLGNQPNPWFVAQQMSNAGDEHCRPWRRAVMQGPPAAARGVPLTPPSRVAGK